MPPARLDFSGALDLALPRACAGCRAPRVTLCPDCLEELAGTCFRGGPQPVLPFPTPVGLDVTWASGAYAGVLARALRAYKDHGRRDLHGVLALLLTRSVRAAMGQAPEDTLVVPLPSSARANRTRGERPVPALALTAATQVGLPMGEALRVVRRVKDAVGLTSAQRAANIAGALRAHEPLVRGRGVLLIDDIITTGASMAEAQRALEAAGAVLVGQAVVAAAARSPVAQPLPNPGELS
jgi:predicted amidophosphoribosyltransferase